MGMGKHGWMAPCDTTIVLCSQLGLLFDHPLQGRRRRGSQRLARRARMHRICADSWSGRSRPLATLPFPGLAGGCCHRLSAGRVPFPSPLPPVRARATCLLLPFCPVVFLCHSATCRSLCRSSRFLSHSLSLLSLLSSLFSHPCLSHHPFPSAIHCQLPPSAHAHDRNVSSCSEIKTWFSSSIHSCPCSVLFFGVCATLCDRQDLTGSSAPSLQLSLRLQSPQSRPSNDSKKDGL